MTTGKEEHMRHAPEKLNYCLIVTSDRVFKGEKKDEITPRVKEIIDEGEDVLYMTSIVPNSIVSIRDVVIRFSYACDVILVTGGTGVRPKDVSIEAVEKIAQRRLPGFGEIFRARTWERHGALAWLSRAAAYIVNNSIVFVVPGSLDAVETALREIIIPEARHAVGELRRK